MNEPSPTPLEARPEPHGPSMALVAVVVGAVCGLTMMVMFRSGRSDGPVRFNYRQPPPLKDRPADIEFDLPAGWGVVYNGHQAWRGASVVDASGQPRVEVWLHETDQPPPAEANEVTFTWGKARLAARHEEGKRAFHSFPRVKVGRLAVIDCYVGRGLLSFGGAADDAEWESVVWGFLRGLRLSP